MLNLEDEFGGLVRQLRRLADIKTQDQLAKQLTEFGTGLGLKVSLGRNTIGAIEGGGTSKPQKDTVELMCKFFFAKRALKSREDIAWFCFRGGFRVERLEFSEEQIRFELLALKGTGFREVIQLVLEDLGNTFPEPGSSFVRGLERVSEIIASLVPAPPGRLSRLEARTRRMLSAERWDSATGEQLASDLERAYQGARKNYADAFRLAHFLSKVEERRAHYAEALQWCERAYHLASTLAVGGAPLIKEPLAALCEAAGAACLNRGQPEDWESAHKFFARAVDLRQELKQALSLQVEISEEHDTEALFQLARYWTHKEKFDEAEERYKAVLERAASLSKPVLRAHALKELADNYRLAKKEGAMTSTFKEALQAYRDVPRRAFRNDPALEIELHLNIAYCHRRLDDEPAAVKELMSALDLAHERRDARRVSYACLQLARSPDIQKTPGEAAFYALVASEIMTTTGAKADAKQADAIVTEQNQRLSPNERLAVEDRVRRCEYRVYASNGAA